MRAVLLPALTLGAVAACTLAEQPVAEQPVRPAGTRPPASAGFRSEAVAPMPPAPETEPDPLHPTASQIDAVARVLLTFGAGPEPPRAAEDRPVRLATMQMDAITAGLAAVDVTAFAIAQGSEGFIGTDTRTDAIGNEWIEVAYGVGYAHAVGDDAAVDVATSVHGDGDHVTDADLRFVASGPGYALGQTTGFVIAIDADHPRFGYLRHKFDRLADRLERGYEGRLSRLQRMSERLAPRGGRGGGERLAHYLEWGYASLVSFVERGYDHLVDTAKREYDRAARQLERRSVGRGLDRRAAHRGRGSVQSGGNIRR